MSNLSGDLFESGSENYSIEASDQSEESEEEAPHINKKNTKKAQIELSSSEDEEKDELETEDDDEEESQEQSEPDDTPIKKTLKKTETVSSIDEEQEEQESESEDEIVPMKKNTKKKNLLVSSDDEEEDNEEVKLLMSPRTRRSIGFTRYRSSRDDEENSASESEDEESNESDAHTEESEEEDEDEDDDEEEKALHSPNTRKSIGGRFIDHSSSEVGSSAVAAHESQESTILKTINYDDEHEPELVVDLTHDEETHEKIENVRLSIFESSIVQKLSSTVVDEDGAGAGVDGGGKVEPSLSVIEESGSGMSESSDVVLISDSPVKKQEAKVVLQPKLNAFANKNVKVSQSFYNSEAKKIEELNQKIETLKGLLKKAGPELEDKGARLKNSIKELISKKVEYEQKLETYQIDESKDLKKSLQKSVEADVQFVEETPAPKPLNWEEIKRANDLVLPKHTGERGLQTFGNQKEKVEAGLNKIHGSWNTQPAEDEMAETPEALKVELMQHQKTGLRWLLWREESRPRGGILADDMGLGKTLSMISLILTKLDDDKENEEQNDSDEDSLDDDDEENPRWHNKRKGERYQGGTLVICPATLLGQWEGEFKNRVRSGYVHFTLHHGSKREIKARRLSRWDVVCTTYNIVSSEYKDRGALFQIKWKRIVLDEAHIIRNHKTQISISCSELSGTYRWAMTGTPVNNKEMDIFALFRFLRVRPFDDLPTYKRWLEDKRGGGSTRLHAIIKTLLLRRTKQALQEKEELSLPEREWKVINVKFTQLEKNVYQKVLAYSRELFTQYLAQQQNAEKTNLYHVHDRYQRAHGQNVQVHQILTILLRLRQLCCHPGLIKAMIEESDLDTSRLTDLENIDLIKVLENLNLSNDNDDSRTEEVQRAAANLLTTANPVFNLSNPSSKIKEVMKHFREEILNTNDKAVLVSQWTSFLDLFEPHLLAMGVKICKINGKVPVKDRGAIVDKFNEPNRGPKVMLLALTAGGVGLNLVGANHLYLLDLHWNPQLESQAQDRIYRVGQKKKVNIYKFMVTEAIEERILGLQQNKLEIANSVLTGSKNLGSKLTMQDLRTLFEV